MTLGEILDRSTQKFPEKIAIVFKDRQIPYNDLAKDSNKLGRALHAMGIGKDDKVGILMGNCPELIVGIFGTLKACAVFVVLNPLLSGRDLTYVINHADIQVILAAPPYDELLVMLRPQIPQVKYLFTVNKEPEEGQISIPVLIESYDGTSLKPDSQQTDLAAIHYTAGTTGLPKGVMLTHTNILTNIVTIGKLLQINRQDIFLTCIPMFSLFTLTISMMLPLLVGATNVLLDNFLPQPVLQDFHTWKVSIFAGVPSMFAVLANMPHLERYDFSHFRLGLCVETTLTKKIAEKFIANFSGHLYVGYGLTECSPVVSIGPLNQRKIEAVGKAVERVMVKIIDRRGDDVQRNTVGEIIVRGPNIMKGYYKNEAATKQAMREGWFHTGDLGYMDVDEFIFITDRKDNVFLVDGKYVFPKEIERVLMQYPGIEDVGVIGIEDPIRGEVPKAYVLPKSGANIDKHAVLTFCRQHLAPFQLPHSIEVIDEIPRSINGKILKRHLRDIARLSESTDLNIPQEEFTFNSVLKGSNNLNDQTKRTSMNEVARTIPPLLQRKIKMFLGSLPNIYDRNVQQALIYHASLDSQLLGQIKFDVATDHFIELLVATANNYGLLEDGRDSLEAILEATKDSIGLDKRSYCDQLIRELYEIKHSHP